MECGDLSPLLGAHLSFLPSALKNFSPNGAASSSPGLPAPRGLPWVGTWKWVQPQRGCGGSHRWPGHNPVGVGEDFTRVPRVARSSQPWAGGRSPVGAAEREPALQESEMRPALGQATCLRRQLATFERRGASLARASGAMLESWGVAFRSTATSRLRKAETSLRTPQAVCGVGDDSKKLGRGIWGRGMRNFYFRNHEKFL